MTPLSIAVPEQGYYNKRWYMTKLKETELAEHGI
jgi:hypothetical protein